MAPLRSLCPRCGKRVQGQDVWGLVYDRKLQQWHPDHAHAPDGKRFLFYWFDAACAEKTLGDQGRGAP